MQRKAHQREVLNPEAFLRNHGGEMGKRRNFFPSKFLLEERIEKLTILQVNGMGNKDLVGFLHVSFKKLRIEQKRKRLIRILPPQASITTR